MQTYCQKGLHAATRADAAVDVKPSDTFKSPPKKQDSLTRRILSQPQLEGEPLKFLKSMEAYWTVRLFASERRFK